MGIGWVSDVPRFGKVNVGAALNQEVNEAPPSEWATYTYDWGRPAYLRADDPVEVAPAGPGHHHLRGDRRGGSRVRRTQQAKQTK
jgi:hypothetical protein